MSHSRGISQRSLINPRTYWVSYSHVRRDAPNERYKNILFSGRRASRSHIVAVNKYSLNVAATSCNYASKHTRLNGCRKDLRIGRPYEKRNDFLKTLIEVGLLHCLQRAAVCSPQRLFLFITSVVLGNYGRMQW